MVQLLILSGNDLDLCSGRSHKKHFIQHHRVNQYQKDTIDDLFFIGKYHLEDQNRKIKHIEHNRYRKSEFLIQYQRRDIHTSC